MNNPNRFFDITQGFDFRAATGSASKMASRPPRWVSSGQYHTNPIIGPMTFISYLGSATNGVWIPGHYVQGFPIDNATIQGNLNMGTGYSVGL
jgi:hypothetical protein